MKSSCKSFRFIFPAIMLALSLSPVLAQIQVSGVVTDASSGETLVGATVRIEGTTAGTVTGIDGRYSLLLPGDDAMLVFSFVGYESLALAIDGRVVIDAALLPDVAMLSEMVVIGYGVVRKDDLTGSVSVISSDDLNRIPSSSFSKAIQGRAAGVMVTQTGEPGMEAQIRVRGVGSINQDPNPIYVIDGIITNSLGAVHPTDIESIQVLKDASAAAIYGADGANGVIIITTRRGEKGKPQVNYSSYASLNLVPRQFEVMNADEYSTFYSTLLQEADILVPQAYSSNFRQWYYGEGWQQGTDWQDEVTRAGLGHHHNLRISGGGDDSNYSLSMNYFGEEGILRASDSERFSLRANSDFNLGRYVRVGETFSITRATVRTPSFWQGGPWQVTLITSPLMRMYNENNKGGFEGPQISYEYPDPDNPAETLIVTNTGFNDKPNPRGPIEIGDFRTHTTSLLANIFVEVKPFSWLTFRTMPSVDAGFVRTKDWFPAFDMGVRSRGQAQLTEMYNEAVNLSLENQLTFSNTFQKHQVTATAVHHVRKNQAVNLGADASGFPYENLNVISMSLEDGRQVSGSNLPFASISYLGRLIYQYDGKYLLTASLRRDGNSRFGPENRWGTFPSVSVAWKVNDDLFTDVREISLLKLRAGWGKTGNSAIGYFQYQSLMDGFEQFSPVFGVNHIMNPALNVVHSFGNPAIRWEAAQMLNIGFDLNLFDDKIQFSTDYYVKDQNDLLVMIPVSSAHGRNYQGEAGETTAGDPWVNLGELQNRGFEFNGIYRHVGSRFGYHVSANLTTIKNQVKYIRQRFSPTTT
jgi:TonB-dependent starch-binding outer membrane protein SusC